jgi:hypothetical protein
MNPLFCPFDFKPDPMDTARRSPAPSNSTKPSATPPDTVPSSTPGGEPQLPDNTAEGVVPAEGDPSARDGVPGKDPRKADGKNSVLNAR